MISRVSFPLHKKKLFISHLCNRRHTSQIRISETFFIELARIRSILLQYKEYMGQALYQERGAMPVRSFCLSGGYNPKLLVLETLLSGYIPQI